MRGRLIAPVLVLLLGAAVRIAPLTDNRFHPDEALYASYGRLISTGDWNLATRLVDKPPLPFYLMAGAFMRIGPNEVAARVPALAASIVSLALVWRLALGLWGRRQVGLLAMVFYALSPMAVLFAPTAFAEPYLTVWLLAGLVAVSGGRWGWSGVFMALALASKQSALLFLPLVVGLGLVRENFRWRAIGFGIVRFVVPIVVMVLLLLMWDATRSPVEGFWKAGFAVGNPGRLARLDEVAPRLVGWLGWLRYVGGWPVANAMLVGCMLVLIGRNILGRRHSGAGKAVSLRYESVIFSFVIVYLAGYWLVAFNIYDRFLLMLVPLLALLVGRALALALPRWERMAVLGLVGVMAWPGWQAAQSAYPVGGDHGLYDGIDELADYLDGLPADTIIYDHWLGWSLDYYLFDSPAYTTYFVTAGDLAAALDAQSDGQSSVLVLPIWIDADEVLAAVDSSGYEAQVAFETSNRFGQLTFQALTLRRTSDNS